MPGPRNLVPPPQFVARNFGLLSVVQPRYDEPDQHWQNGVTYQNLCGIGGSTFDDYCVTGSAPSKVANMTTPLRGATPFVVFAEVDCPPVGYSEAEIEARVADALGRVEPWQVERSFWTGGINVTGGPSGAATTAFPHLAANAQVLDPATVQAIILQPAAVSVTGSTVVDIVEGIGMLEQAMGTCYDGQPVIHVPLQLAEQGFRAGIFKTNGNHVETQAGSLVALGAGYTGSGPDGTSIAGALWIYATGQVFAYRSSVLRFRLRDSIDRNENQTKMIAERTYVLGWDCCLLAVPVSEGGIVTGIVGAPN